MKTPLITEIKENSLDDGPGIRSVVFFKGCPLRCVWCHNPEAIGSGPEVAFDADACLGLLDCMAACPENALDRTHPGFVRRDKCNLCFKCTQTCDAKALRRVGEALSVADILSRLAPYVVFYASSGGGVTLSGGEPTLFPEFCGELCRALRTQNVHILLETCGLFDWTPFEDLILPFLDCVYFDLKIMADDAHQQYCGRSNRRIHENFRRLCRAAEDFGLTVLPRIPLVPGITATPENLAAVAAFLTQNGMKEAALLPYNPLWPGKAAKIGRSNTYHHTDWQRREELEACRRWLSPIKIV